MKKILLVFGTRPEAIKMAPVIREFKEHTENCNTVVCVTAQHREMLDQVLQVFEIIPDIDLDIMQKGQDLIDITTRVLRGISDVLEKEKPDLVLVHGDTTTSTVAALAAFYKHINVGHVEAGLRTYNLSNPWPEELNRQITSRIASLHFAPTERNRQNLINEGVDPSGIFVTGNTVIDAIKLAISRIESSKTIIDSINAELNTAGLPPDIVDKWDGVKGKRKMVLITGHRRENFGAGIKSICEAVKELALQNSDVDFVYPVHLNPNVHNLVYELLGKSNNATSENSNISCGNVWLIDPLGYLPFIYLMKKCYCVLTDSGGIQEEAPGLGKPVLVMRDTTERPEAIETGIVKLIGTSEQRIIKELSRLLTDKEYYHNVSAAVNPFGDGKAGVKIVARCFNYILK